MQPTIHSPRAPHSWRRTALRILGLVLVGYLLVILMMVWAEDSLVYFPSPYDGSNLWHPADFAFEDAWFQAEDGTRLHGWYLSHTQPRAVVLMAHGNAGNVAEWSDLARQWHDGLGVSILLFDYRGYGRSEGKPSEAGLYRDARAARTWLAHRTGVAEQDIVLFGRSIGGAVMVDLAVDGARGLVLERTFTSAPDVAAHHYPWLPVNLLMHNRYDSLSKIARFHGPLLISHGTSDSIVPYELGRQLFDAAHEPKQFFPVERGDHNDPQPAAYYHALAEFLDHLPPISSSHGTAEKPGGNSGG